MCDGEVKEWKVGQGWGRARRAGAQDDREARLWDQGEEAEPGDGWLHPSSGEDDEAEAEALGVVRDMYRCGRCRAMVFVAAGAQSPWQSTWPVCSWCQVLKQFEVGREPSGRVPG